MIPIMFFFVAAGLASIGPGNIASAALMAPIAMAVGGRASASVPDGDHGRQRRQCRIALAFRAYRHYRQRTHGEDRHVRFGLADLLDNLVAHALVTLAATSVRGIEPVRVPADPATQPPVTDLPGG